MNDLISVIVPVYNVEAYVGECIESIVGQTYQNLEILLVNDGSKDGSLAILNRAAASDSRITVIDQENRGLSGARNAGIDRAKGEYFLFVDSDDKLEPNTVEKLHEAVLRAGAKLAICNLNELDDASGELTPRTVITEEKSVSGTDIMREKAARTNEITWCMVMNKLYHRSIFDELRFPERKLHEDEFVFHKVMRQCDRVVCLPDCLYIYRRRAGSIMTTKWKVTRFDGIEALMLRCADYLKMPDFTNPALATFLDAAYIYEKFYTANRFENAGEYAERIAYIQTLAGPLAKQLRPAAPLKERFWMRRYENDMYGGIVRKVKFADMKRGLKKLFKKN